MSFDSFFQDQLDQLKQGGNYRYFADLERRTGKFPRATNHFEGGTRDVTVWCSNDDLGMGQNPLTIAAMCEAIERHAQYVVLWEWLSPRFGLRAL